MIKDTEMICILLLHNFIQCICFDRNIGDICQLIQCSNYLMMSFLMLPAFPRKLPQLKYDFDFSKIGIFRTLSGSSISNIYHNRSHVSFRITTKRLHCSLDLLSSITISKLWFQANTSKRCCGVLNLFL